jgi:hypothetical protein
MARAQVYYIEFIIAIFFFTLMLGLFVNSVISAQDDSGLGPLTTEARAVSEHLMSEGVPGDWNLSNVQKIGLTDGKSRINETKLQMFSNMSYSQTRSALNIGSEYYFYLEDRNSSRILIAGKQGIGLEPADAKRVIKNLRLAIYGSEIVKMVVLVWQ